MLNFKLIKKKIKRNKKLFNILVKPYRFFKYEHFHPPVVSIRNILDNNLGAGSYFVQIGAFDGTTDDPIYDLVMSRGWSGIVIEPQEFAFNLLKENYKNRSDVICLNIAVGEVNGEKILYSVKTVSPVPSWSKQVASLDKNMLTSCGLDGEIIEKRTKCITLSSLFDKYRITKLDLLLTDIEGYDAEIIRTVPFAKLKPKFIVFEHKHLDPSSYKNIIRFLKGNGYRLGKEGGDTIAF